MHRSRFQLVLIVLAACVPLAWLLWQTSIAPKIAANSVVVKIHTHAGLERVELQRQAHDDSLLYIVTGVNGERQSLTPDQYAARLHNASALSGNWINRAFNISSPFGIVWVSIGLLGQLLFTGRMAVQWLATERRGQSVVPPLFWWMSLIGALMLLTYFMWRQDIVGVLGQSFGLVVYIRNLQYIRSPKP